MPDPVVSSTILRPDDLTVGQHIAILNPVPPGTPYPPPPSTPSESLSFSPPPLTAAHSLTRGLPLRIIGISLPFVSVVFRTSSAEENGPLILDVRTLTLARLDPSYVRAITEFQCSRPISPFSLPSPIPPSDPPSFSPSLP